ncbi:MAG: hypothetical protein L6V93_17755 [Clostridiales bacterium]|nr:MAG: hypothetical protein L6V93_17755 [Clostridiales bacterium]
MSVEVYGENYAGNNVGIALMMRKGNTFAKMISGTVDTMAQNGKMGARHGEFLRKTLLRKNGNTSFPRTDLHAQGRVGGERVGRNLR